MTDCPCGSGQSYSACCQPFITGTAIAPTPEALMRSRYSAFTVVDIDYLHDTLAPEARHDFNRADVEKWAKESQWQGLEIHATTGGGAEDTEGTVDFTARQRWASRSRATGTDSPAARQAARASGRSLNMAYFPKKETPLLVTRHSAP